MTNLSSVRASLFFLFSLIASTSAVGRPALVVIDAGHGGHDRGGMPGQRLAEKGFRLDTVQRLARVLGNSTGIKAVLTRHDDTFVSLTERTNIANQFAGRDAISSRSISTLGYVKVRTESRPIIITHVVTAWLL